ncbi:MAG: GH3 auxin-responsive promoter family protein [Tannerellaceae bacterium]|jgi:hypothetical protein|nr:GH3 auxin-responsive promoter family protein [Tannerellaceae bacterium]
MKGIPTSLVYRLLKPRLRELARYGPEGFDIQERQLAFLLQRGRDTVWGKRFGLRELCSYEGFRARIPLQTYDGLKAYIRRMINGEGNILWPSQTRWYAKSSGTTSDKSKFIPLTSEILHACHYRGSRDAIALYLENHNRSSALFSGKGIILGGSHAPSPLNIRSRQGDLSAVLLQRLNPLYDFFRVPEKRIILMDEWEEKIEAVVRRTCRTDISSLTGVPSWMLVLLKAVMEARGAESLTDVWPQLEVFFHGGVSFTPYRDIYRRLIPSEKMHYVETYNASEGFFGIQSTPEDGSLLLMLDYGIFYEFLPLEGEKGEEGEKAVGVEAVEAVPLEGVRKGVHYAMVVTTAGGLWRYCLGDTIRFTSLHPHKFIITGRTRHFINAFGEELMVDNADRAITETNRLSGASVSEYTAAPLFLEEEGKGRHQWLIEFTTPPPSLEEYARLLDVHLKRLNSDYEAKRQKNLSLQQPEVIAARQGLFHRWLQERGQLGGQHKVPRLANDRRIMEQLLQLNGCRRD